MPAGRVDLLAVDREARVTGQHDVELLVPAPGPSPSSCSSTTSCPAVGAVYAFTPNPFTPSAWRSGCQSSVPPTTEMGSSSEIRTVRKAIAAAYARAPPRLGVVPLASIGDSFSSFFDAVGQFFDNLASINWGALLFGAAAFGTYLTLRSRAYFHVLRAAYPTEPIQFRRIWGAYIAAYGFNNVVPGARRRRHQALPDQDARSRTRATRRWRRRSSSSSSSTSRSAFILTFAFTQGVFPKPPDFSKLDAFDLSFFASHPRFTLFLLTALASPGSWLRAAVARG